jgi:hypothetical protein
MTKLNRNTGVMTDWVSYTPTFIGLGTISAIDYAKYKIEGDSVRIMMRFSSGTPTATAIQISLPNNYTVSSFINSGNAGEWIWYNNAGNTVKTGKVLLYGNTSYLMFSRDEYVTTNYPFTPLLGTEISAGVSLIAFECCVPIANLSSNVLIADRALEEYVSWDGSTIVKGSAGALIPTGTPAAAIDRFDITTGFSQIQPTDSFNMEFLIAGIGPWLPSSQGSTYISPLLYDGTNFIGAGVESAGGAVVMMSKGKYCRQTGSTAGVWSTVIPANTRWRVRKVSGGAQVGFPVSTANVIGRTDGLAPSTGYIGETFGTERASTSVGSSFSIRSTTALTAAVSNIVSITLNKGTYLVGGKFAGFHLDGTVRNVFAAIGINSVSVTLEQNDGLASATSKTVSITGIPIVIKTDNTIVSLRGGVTGLTGSWSVDAAGNELWVVRIA